MSVVVELVDVRGEGGGDHKSIEYLAARDMKL